MQQSNRDPNVVPEDILENCGAVMEIMGYDTGYPLYYSDKKITAMRSFFPTNDELHEMERKVKRYRESLNISHLLSNIFGGIRGVYHAGHKSVDVCIERYQYYLTDEHFAAVVEFLKKKGYGASFERTHIKVVFAA